MTKERKVELAKTIIGAVSTVGIGTIIGNVINASSPIKTNFWLRICVVVGGAAVTGVVAMAAQKYIDHVTDEIVGLGDTIKELGTEPPKTVEQE